MVQIDLVRVIKDGKVLEIFISHMVQIDHLKIDIDGETYETLYPTWFRLTPPP